MRHMLLLLQHQHWLRSPAILGVLNAKRSVVYRINQPEAQCEYDGQAIVAVHSVCVVLHLIESQWQS